MKGVVACGEVPVVVSKRYWYSRRGRGGGGGRDPIVCVLGSGVGVRTVFGCSASIEQIVLRDDILLFL